MEFERALFRVYDKSMEAFRYPRVRSVCNLAQKTLLVLSAALFATLFLLHHEFVDKPGEVPCGTVLAGVPIGVRYPCGVIMVRWWCFIPVGCRARIKYERGEKIRD